MGKVALLAVLAYVGGVIFTFVYGAQWAFYLYQIVYFLNPGNRWWSGSIPSFSYSMVSVIVLFIAYILNKKDFTHNKLSESPQFKLLFVLIGIYCVTYFYAISQQLHEVAMIDYIKMIVVMSVAYKILDNKDKLEASLLVYVVGSAYIGYEAMVSGRNSQGRVEGIGLVDAPEANGTAAAIVASLPMMIYFFWWGNKKIKFLVLLLGPVIINGLVLINSRGSFLGAIAGCVVFMWSMLFAKLKTKRQRTVAILLLIVGLSGTLSLIDDSFLDRMTTLTDVEDEGASGSHRYHFWLATFDVVADYPFGVGAYGYEILSQLYLSEEFFVDREKGKAVHSIWFQALSEVGWLGFFVFLMLMLSAFYSLIKIKKQCVESEDLPTFYLAHALFSSFVGLLVTSSFINQFRVQVLYWFILYIASLYSIVVINNNGNVKQ